MMTVNSIIKHLQTIVGEDYVLTKPQDLVPYETPWRGKKGKAACVVRPSDTKQVSEIVSYLVSHHIPYIIQSGNTGLVGASTPNKTGEQIILSLNRLNHIFEIDSINTSVHVGAGVRLSALNEAVSDEDLFFPIDISADPCIGGMVSTNTGGSRFLKYGGVRENILGLKVVLNDSNGTILDLTSKLHKNNTGLDTKQIFIGTSGQFGIVTESIVKLSATPKQIATALIVPSSDESLPVLLEKLERSFGSTLSAFEGMSKNAIEAVFIHSPAHSCKFGDTVPEYVCLIELNRSWDKKEYECDLDEALQIELENLITEHPDLIKNAYLGSPHDHWALRHALSESVQKSGKLISFDLSFGRTEAVKFRSYILKELPKKYEAVKVCDFGHIGDGAIHLNLVIPHDDQRLSSTNFIPSLREWVLDIAVKQFQGSFSAEHGIGSLNQQAYENYISKAIQTFHDQVKCR